MKRGLKEKEVVSSENTQLNLDEKRIESQLSPLVKAGRGLVPRWKEDWKVKNSVRQSVGLIENSMKRGLKA